MPTRTSRCRDGHARGQPHPHPGGVRRHDGTGEPAVRPHLDDAFELAGAVVAPDAAGVRVRLAEPLRGVAPGQAVAFYRPDPAGDVVIGSARITATAG